MRKASLPLLLRPHRIRPRAPSPHQIQPQARTPQVPALRAIRASQPRRRVPARQIPATRRQLQLLTRRLRRLDRVQLVRLPQLRRLLRLLPTDRREALLPPLYLRQSPDSSRAGEGPISRIGRESLPLTRMLRNAAGLRLQFHRLPIRRLTGLLEAPRRLEFPITTPTCWKRPSTRIH
jgi:hypothetical protein